MAQHASLSLRAALELNPWSGEPYVRTDPHSSMRTHAFAAAGGDGFVVYLVLVRDRLVDLLQIIWFG